jgi:hypothetical protein
VKDSKAKSNNLITLLDMVKPEADGGDEKQAAAALLALCR